MTTTTHTEDEDSAGLPPDADQALPGLFLAEPGGTRIDVPLGRRVMVVSDLLLTPEATPSTRALTTELAQALDTWDGPGILIVAGNLFDLTGCDDPLGTAGRAIDAHPALARAFLHFLQVDDRRILRQRGTHEPEEIVGGLRDHVDGASDVVARLAEAGVEHLGAVDLHLQTGTGERVVRVEPGTHVYAAATDIAEPTADTKPGIAPASGRHWHNLVDNSPEDAPWLDGVRQLSDPSALSRFVVSRTLYRRFGKYAWWLLVPFGVAVLIRVAVTPWLLATSGAGCRPGPCATPTPPTSTTSW